MSDILDYITNEQQIDDNYLLNLHQQLKQMKQQRKQSEKDAAVINTRVNCLKNEQAKTLKRIELTKQKTKQKAISIERKENEIKEKHLFQQRKEAELASLKKRNLIEKTKLINSMSSKRNTLIKFNQEEAKLLKEQQRKNEELMQNIIDMEISDKKNRVEFIKNQHEINEEQKRFLDKISKKNAIKLDLEEKIRRELMIKEENDIQIEMLKQKEIEILTKINDIRLTHKLLIEDFQKLYTGDIYDNNNNNKK
jgi:hypothetical protein